MSYLSEIRNAVIKDTDLMVSSTGSITGEGSVGAIAGPEFGKSFLCVRGNIVAEIFADKVSINGNEHSFRSLEELLCELHSVVSTDVIQRHNERCDVVDKCAQYIWAHAKFFNCHSEEQAINKADDFVREYGVHGAWNQVCCVPDDF